MLTLPGEGLGIALLNYLIAHRESMSQENRDRADKLMLDSVQSGNEESRRFWNLLLKPLLKALEAAQPKE